MISIIASLLHLPPIDDALTARREIARGSWLVREDDVKAVVVRLRDAYDALNAELLDERANGPSAEEWRRTAKERDEWKAKAEELVAALRDCRDALRVSTTPLPEDRATVLRAQARALDAIEKAEGR